MVGGYYGQGVPTSVDLENNSNTKKYTINQSPKGKVVISKLVCFFLVMGALLLAALAALAVYIFLPVSCVETPPEALTDVENTQIEQVTNARLPQNLRPTHYRLKIMPFLIEDNFTSHGFISIDINVKEPTDKIVLNINDIQVDRDSVRVKYPKENNFVKILDQGYNKEAQIYTVQLNRNLDKGEDYKLEMNFVSNLSDNMQGFYRSRYWDRTTNQTKWMASTQFSPTDARRAFPCFDEPSFKAVFSITIGRPANMTSLSNMPKEKSFNSTEMAGYVWDKFSVTLPMSTYLVAFVVSDLQPFQFNTTGKLFTIWTRRDSINQSLYSSEIGPKFLKYFEDYFNIAYPLPKIDMVAVPDFGFNAMENWGLITFRENILLLDNKVTTIDNKRETALVIAHEIAHQWFGNLVTPKWWDDLWLKEGFATYFSYRGVNEVEPTWRIQEKFQYSELGSAFEVDSLISSKPLSFKVQNSNQIRQTFNEISYSKGASIIKMMRNFLGEETFKTGLIQYLNSHRFSNADHNDLWKALSDKAHTSNALEPNMSVKEIMDSWTIQPGFPVITAINDYNGTIRLTQKRFLLYGESEEESTWWVPISYTTETEKNFENTKPKFWLKENETEIQLDTKKEDWWVFNLKQTGYYIVNYDEQNWNRLVHNIFDFPSEIRAQLLSNAMDLARANLLDYGFPIRMLLQIGGIENTLLPLLVAFDKLEFLESMLITTPIYTKYQEYLLLSFHAIFENTQFVSKPTDSYMDQKKQRTILHWACKQPDSRCINHSRHLFRAWMTTKQPIAPNVRDTVYCTAIREGGEQEWDFAFYMFQETPIVAEKNRILDALGCTTKPWLLTRYLHYMMHNESGIRKQDGARVFNSVARNIVGNTLAFDFLRSNWKAINDYYGVAFNIVGKMVEGITMYMNTPYQLSQLESFKKENSLGTTQRAFDNAIEVVKGNVEWMRSSYKGLENWLIQHSIEYNL